MVKVNRFEGSMAAVDPASWRMPRRALRGATGKGFELDATAAGGGSAAVPLEANQDVFGP